jgi:hypothetical protein
VGRRLCFSMATVGAYDGACVAAVIQVCDGQSKLRKL